MTLFPCPEGVIVSVTEDVCVCSQTFDTLRAGAVQDEDYE